MIDALFTVHGRFTNPTCIDIKAGRYNWSMEPVHALPDVLDALADYQVVDDNDDDPVLLNADGTPIDTWRESYPYDQRLDRTTYEHHKRLLQIELLKLQQWVKATGERIVIVFEGRDAAGKGGTIKRFMEHLNPRAAPASSRWRSRPSVSARSGTSSAM